MLKRIHFLTLFLSFIGTPLLSHTQSTPSSTVVGALNSIAFALSPLDALTDDLAKGPELNLVKTYGTAGSANYYGNKPFYYFGYALGTTGLASLGYALQKDLRDPKAFSHAVLLISAAWMALIEGENYSLNTKLSEGTYSPFMPCPNYSLQYASLGLLAGYALFSKNPLVSKLMACLAVTAVIMDATSSTFLSSTDKPPVEHMAFYATLGFLLAGWVNRKPVTTKPLGLLIAAWTAAGVLANGEILLYSLTNNS